MPPTTPPSVDAVRAQIWSGLNAQVVDSLITNLATAQCERDIWRERAIKAEADCAATKEKLAPKPEILTTP